MLTNLDWEGALPTLLEVAKNGTSAKGRREAFDSLKIMARLADAFGQEIVIEVFPMAGETIADKASEVEYWDILVRPDGGDPIFEFEGLTEAQADAYVEQLTENYPAFGYSDLRELLK